MKRALWVVPVLLLVLCGWLVQKAHAYNYWSPDLYSTYPDTYSWITSGSVSSTWDYSGGDGGVTGNGLILSAAYHNSVAPVMYEGDVMLTIRNPSSFYYGAGGYYRAFYLASADTAWNGSSGTFRMAELYCGNSSSIVTLYQGAGGVETQIGNSVNGPACYDNMTLRVVFQLDYSGPETLNELIYVGSQRLISNNIPDAAALSGYVGVGVQSLPSGSVVSHLDLATRDSYAPNPVSSSSIGVSPYYNHIDLQWPATTDDSIDNSGVYDYEIWRDGSFLGSTTGLTFSDATVIPDHYYNYTLKAVDYHLNAAPTNFTAHTQFIGTSPPFPSATPEGRRVGLRPTGAYWGAGGEQIDVMSGNLNFTLPMLNAQARGSWSVNFSLNYNAQNWRNDSGGNWKYGHDVGYGFGWRLMAGSITPVLSDPYTVDHYLYLDSTGAEYRLDQNSSNVWSSKESVYLYFDANASTLHFRDGSFWEFDCVSASSEDDPGVMYPTLMEDTNGNQILVRYNTGSGASWINSSARISEIEDVRASNPDSTDFRTYNFLYNTDSPPHLTSITNTLGLGDSLSQIFTFTYLSNQSLYSPFDSASFPSTTLLRHVTVPANSTYHELSYNGSGELTEILLPYKGYLSYDYTTTTYPSGAKFREVVHRYLSKDGSSQTQYSFSHESSPGYAVHQYTVLDDPGGVGEKYWAFGTSGATMGLVTQYQGRHRPGPVTKKQDDYTWTQDSVSNSYISAVQTTADPGQTYAAVKKTAQTVDTHGNVTEVDQYNYGDLTDIYHSQSYTYVSSSSYTSRYMFNRLSSATGGVSISYDDSTYYSSPPTGVREWDTANSSLLYYARGNPVSITTPTSYTSLTYNFGGAVVSSTTNGVTKSVTIPIDYNYAAPTQITVGSLTASMSYSSFLGLTNETSPTGSTLSVSYDSMGRPTTSTSPFGATTTTSYYPTASPPYTLTSVNGRWTKTTLDGLGRTIKVETGHDSTTVSVTDTVYDSCGCSPTGKMTQTSEPHAPSDTVVWTTYTYDGIGRTLSVIAPDGNSTTNYSYQGNTVTVTDPAGHWKKYTTDVLGQLVQLNEPNPAGGSDYVTTYTYDWFGHLTQISMPRPTGTQTRTSNYGSPAGPLLLSITNPENGTVSYTYNSDSTLATKTDAKSQQVQYSYDSLKRVTQIRRGTLSGSTFTEDTCQQENYTYGTTGYALGRLISLQYMGGYSAGTCDTTFTESYTYSQPGATLTKSLSVARPNLTSMTLTSSYTYDNEGRMTAVQYPSSWNGSSWVAGPNLGNTFDSMGRLQKLTDLTASSDIISAATYGAAGQMLTMTGNNGAPSESRTYNSMLQLTDLTSGSLHYQYAFSGIQNNAKITSETDVVSGEQITYTYDSLNRLASATSSVTPGWGQSYNYDGFGNLTTQTVTKGTAPALSVSYDATTNRRTGECSDANGNINSSTSCTNGEVYDIQNRLVRNGGSSLAWVYSYAPSNKRIWRGGWSGSTQTTDEITFWGVNGQKLASYNVSLYGVTLVGASTGAYQYFGGKLIKNKGGYVTRDRLGSIGKFFPFGQERPSATTDGTEKFATYFRDSETGLDYAENRYHEPGAGRFRTPDPAHSGSNWYNYAGGDPVNNTDHNGTDDCPPETICIDVFDPEVDWGFLSNGLDVNEYGDQVQACVESFGLAAYFPQEFLQIIQYCGQEAVASAATQVGNGTGGPTTGPPTQSWGQTTSALRSTATSAMYALGSGCTGALTDAGLYDDMIQNAGTANYYQAFGATGRMTLSDLGYSQYQPSPTLEEWCTDAIACDAGNTGILVTNLFYSENTTDQLTTLVHELLHYTVAANGGTIVQYSDTGIADMFNLSYTDPTSASQAITNWLNQDCPTTP
jgi:RHS repeat-associated protein